MAVTEYKPTNTHGCRYSYDKLENVVFLVSEDHIKDIHIDNGEAYITDLTEAPLRLEAFNIQLSEESSLDERYKFTKSVTFSLNGYVPFDNINEKFYVILKSVDGTKWMVNVDFPANVTYTFNLDASQYHTDFTFSSVSNFPTLRLASDIDEGEETCKEFRVTGIDTLRMLESDYCRFERVSGTVHTYGHAFVGVDFLKNTCSLQESYDGDKVTTTVQFNIAFDAYKSSWHYNLLEFLKNRYSTIIKVKGIEKYFFSGFNYGLQPSFTVSTTSQNGESDIITITLVETSLQGSTSRVSWSEVEETETRWVYIRNVGNIQGWECVGLGIARYLLQQEVNQLGEPTGRYKAFTGYTSHFPTLNIVGEFDQEYRFSNSECTEAICQVNTDIPTTIVYNAPSCYTYSFSAGCDWYAAGMETYMTVTPFSGTAGNSYTLSICNTKLPTGSESSTFEIVAGNNTKIVNVNLTTDNVIINPRSVAINCLQQNVPFTFYQYCPVTVTSIDQRLTYNLTNNQLIVSVPRNYSTASGVTWSIGVKDCQNKTATVTINQGKTYERWANTNDFMCSGSTSYVKQARYTGTTSTDINTPTGEYRMGAKIADNDSRCGSSYETKWEASTAYTCVDGNKWSFEEEYKKPQGGNWQKTGNTRLKEMVESASSFCNEEVEYKWVLTDRWQCQGTKLTTVSNNNVTNYVVCNNDSTLQWYEVNSADTRSAITSVEVGECCTALSYSCFSNMSSLTSVTIPNTVTKIGFWAFRDDTALSSITIPNSVEISYNDTYMFEGCTALSEVQLSTSMSAITIGMFRECYSLTGLTIPNSVTIIYGNAFLNAGLKNIVIPDSVTEFNTYGHFNNCSGLTSVTLSNSITSIPDWCFDRCTSLPSITIPTGVTSIGDLAFASCFALTGITIPDSVTSIGQQALQGCTGMTSVTIGTGITEIKAYAFSGCTSLTNITINSITPPTLGGSAFSDTNGCPIYVPAESVQTYKNAGGNWVYLSNRIQAIQ